MINIIFDFIVAKTQRNIKTANKKYDKLVQQNKAKEPLNVRVEKTKTQKVIKRKAVATIAKAIKQHIEPKVEFKNLDKAQNQIEFHLDHIKGYDGLSLSTLYPKLRSRIYSESKKLLIIKNNIKLTMGCNATF